MDRITRPAGRRADLPALPGRTRHRSRQQDPRLCAAGPGLRHGRRQRRHRRPDRGARLRPAAHILFDLGYPEIKLLTNNPAKVEALREEGSTSPSSCR
jgi:hypothetical protein